MSCRSKVSQAGDGGGRAIHAACVSILFENPCEEVQGVVVCFLQHIRVRAEDGSLHRSVLLHWSRKQQECVSVWDSDMERSCAFLVWLCPSLSLVCLWWDHQRAQHNWWRYLRELGEGEGYRGSFNMKSHVFWRKKGGRRTACFLAEWSVRLMKICYRNHQLNSAGSVPLYLSSVYVWR